MEKEGAAKLFLDVFPSLELGGDEKRLMSEVEVTRVGMSRARDLMRVYIRSRRLIPKRAIRGVEGEIERQIFGGRRVRVSLIERYALSGLYTPEKLISLYKESMLEELRDYSRLEYNLLRTAKMEFGSESEMRLTLPDSLIAREKSGEIAAYIEKVVCERCGLSLSVEIAFEEEKESRREEEEQKIRLEVEGVIARANLGGRRAPLENDFIEKAENSLNADLTTKSSGFQDSADLEKLNLAKNTSKSESDARKNAGSEGESDGVLTDSAENSTAANVAASNAAAANAAAADRAARGGRASSRRPDAPDVLYGKDFSDEPVPIESIAEEVGEVTLRGKVISMESREIRGGRMIVMMNLTDFTDTITVKIFLNKDAFEEAVGAGLSEGAYLKVKGVTSIDKFDGDLVVAQVSGIKKIADFTAVRMDTAPERRVELHCHTKMSDMDGVSDVADIIRRAREWGHRAIAITDHGDVQAFPDAFHEAPPGDGIKVIYGLEAYLVDDLREIVGNASDWPLDGRYVVFDLETTGLSPEKCKIIEIGAVRVENGSVTDKFSTFVNPEEPIPLSIEELTSIRDDMVEGAPTIDEVLPRFLEFCSGCAMVAHNADFDMGFIRAGCERMGLSFASAVVDTVALARELLPEIGRYKLDTVANALGVPLGHHHRAVDDAECTAGIFIRFLGMMEERGIKTLSDANREFASTPEVVKKMPTYHAIILAANDVGRINLYRLVSLSHLEYFHSRPRIPKSELEKYREGLILGSACEAGELYRAIVGGRPKEEIASIVNFYDYLEIQPIANNLFMLRSEKEPASSEEDLREVNRRIVALGNAMRKPVVATCDVHFLDPEDEIYRRIIMASRRFSDADQQAPLYLRTTQEMLDEFSYLGEEKAREVVITNPNRIADMCEPIAPVRPDKCPPVIENSDQMLRDICYAKAHSMYGDPLPGIVAERLERELGSIISNGYAVMYIIAQKLVWKSNEDGYLVGSRGSVGSSFAATMAGITEVNPLQAHYRCDYCKYSDFDSPEVKAYAGRSGCDMPDAVCPRCGRKLMKDGFDIPFETFLGFKGNKEPDIDLNFSGEYQSKAHAYCDVIFGYGQTYRAGTIGTLAEKTAYGYAKHYYEGKGERKRKCEIERIVQGCVGVRKTTGQHPGGIVVLPVGEEIHTFTPVQHPANKPVPIITTHFDYHSIDHNLLKLDILGHDDPTMIRMLQDLTGVDPTTIPLDDASVMSLFKDTKALGITPDDIFGVRLGCLGIPEFGTEFAMQMVIDAKPKEFSDLIRLSGLSHGTDVWLGNAKTLIEEGKATISTAICTRDDIMIYLIQMGLDSELSFTIMESVRKGKGLKPEWEEEMRAHGVPDWYIWSCNKIKYMFPKAHAAAYVMMAWRIAYCKVFYPLEYYASYFSIRATGFDYEIMCQGSERLAMHYEEYTARKDELSNREQETYRDMKIVQEMYARGFSFVPIDIYAAKPDRFVIIDGKLMPSLKTIGGMGDDAAYALSEAAKDGPFLSKDDLRARVKLSKTVIDVMADLGLLGDMPESNQLSLFDLRA